MLDFGWIYLPIMSYMLFTIAFIIYMIKVKDQKRDNIFWLFNCLLFLIIIFNYAFNIANSIFIIVFSSLSILISLFVSGVIIKEGKRSA